MATFISTCSPNADRLFGPRVDNECRSFDFTLFFEDVFFSCLPAAFFLCLMPASIIPLLRTPSVCSVRSRLFAAKLTAFSCLIVLQCVFLISRTRGGSFWTEGSLAADIMSLLASVTGLNVSYIDHQRSIRPSTLLSLYLTMLTILDISRVRTLWLIDSGVKEPALMTAILAFTLSALLFESFNKREHITPERKSGSPDQYSGFWRRTTFAWLAATFRAGYSTVISLDDLPALDTNLESHILYEKLVSTWSKYNPHARHSLLRACFRAYLFSFMSGVVPRLCLTVFTFAQPFLIVKLISLVDPEISYGRGLIGAWGLTFVGIASSTAVYQYQNFRFITRMRGGLIGLIYQKTLVHRSVDGGDITAVALMGTDVERISQSLLAIHELWASILDIAIAIWLLERQLFLACVAPVLIIIIFIGLTYVISPAVKSSQRSWIEMVQKRLQIISSMLNDMKVVKMLGLSDLMSAVVQKSRQVEIETSLVFRKLLVWQLLLSNLPVNLAPVSAFTVYVIMAVFWKDESLLTAQAFTSVALISLLSTPVLLFIQTIPLFYQSIGSFDRIQEFCNYTISNPQEDAVMLQHDDVSLRSLTLTHPQHPDLPREKYFVSFNGESFGWDREKLDLKDMSISILYARITAIIGPVGSGKSTFLASILGETITKSPLLRPSLPSVAYCAQQPWLEVGTIRSNIIGIHMYENAWYARVLFACDLEADLNTIPKGDQTVVGSQGLNLSGGQRQRIALARAVYSRCSVVMLDDVFSGMDTRTIGRISGRLFGRQGLLRQHSITVVLTTHNHILEGLADTVIVLENGSIVDVRTPDGKFKHNDHGIDMSRRTAHADATDISPSFQQLKLNHAELRVPTVSATEPNEPVMDSRRKNGDFSVYKYYFASSGYLNFSMFVGCMVLWVFCTEFPTIWLKWWSDADIDHPNKNVGMYMGVYAFLQMSGVISFSVACWFAFVNMISTSSYKLHQDLLRSTLNAPLRFFTTTDVGTLTNRFSQDMELIDMNLPGLLANYVCALLDVVAKMIIIAVFSQYLAVVIPFVGTLLFFLQKYYLQTSRQVRLLEIEAKAPLYTHFLESITGVATIRAFGWQKQYQERNFRFIDASQRAAYLQSCIQSCLSFVLGIIVAVLAVILVAIMVTWSDKFSAGSVGVGLVTVISFGTVLARLINMWTKLESSIGAVARVKRFVAETESENDGNYDHTPEDWPYAGTIEFESLDASHSSEDVPVLNGITMLVEAQKHIAICGRSGSGKSSLLLCLLQMLEIQDGSITIDNIDVRTLSKADVRARINVVPQDLLLMPGTVRFNIDPFGTASSAEIAHALQRVRLWALIEEQGGLDKEMEVDAWSAGQKQLLCLARAIIKKGKILVLDEATSSVDSVTETIMQEIIDTEFKGCTVLAVMHRLEQIDKYDKVALLDNSVLVEYDDTAKLLATPSRFRDLYNLSLK